MSDIEDGKTYLFLTQTVAGDDLDTWCRLVSSICKRQVDWHSYAGYKAVFVVGGERDRELALSAVFAQLSVLRSYYRKALKKLKFMDDQLKEQSMGTLLTSDGTLISQVQLMLNT